MSNHISAVYIPMDRRHALAQGVTLPERTSGAALFADISGFTPLTEALARGLGPRRGAEELTRQLNLVYNALVDEVHRYKGGVISFSGDAITCWFDEQGAQSASSRKQDKETLACLPGLPPASVRATACATACQQAMQQFATVTLPAGETVSLGMKASVASGPARRFVVGDPHIQLIDALAGQTLVRLAGGEHLAGRGEIVVDAQTAAHLGAVARLKDIQARQAEEDRFFVVSELPGEVEPTPWPELAPGALSEEQVRPWVLPPVYTRLQSGLGEFLTELRPAAALFLRFGGLDYDADEGVRAKLDAYVRWVQGVLARYEGSLLQLTIGDKGSYLYAAFGAPIAHEDEARRAVVSALELRRPPAELSFIDQVQIGISQGTLRVGAYGGKARRTYGVLGDEVNLAARLMQNAAPGEVLASRRIQKTVITEFMWETLPAIQVKGKTEAVPVARLVGERRAPVSVALYTNALVGRQAELAHMMHVLERAAAGEGQVLRLEGKAGMGKSRLAAEFAAEAVKRGVRVCVGACQSTTQHMAYFPWRAIFAQLLEVTEASAVEDTPAAHARQVTQLEAVLNQLNPEWNIRLPLLGDLMDLAIPDNATTVAFEPRLRQEALFALAVELVQSYAGRQPLLLLVEDAHWMDEASQGLALALGRVIASLSALLMLVQRPPAPTDAPLLPDLDKLACHRRLDLSELSPDGVAALAADRLMGKLSPLALALIRAQAQGSPFFAEELVDALRETGNLALVPLSQEETERAGEESWWQLSEALIGELHKANCLVKDPASGAWTLCEGARLSAVSMHIPDSVHGAVLSRLDRLPELHKLSLKVASVIGRVFDLETLARAHPSRPDRQDLEAQQQVLLERDFVSWTPPVFMFKHNLTQEVVYETLLAAQQCELHRAVGSVQEALQPEDVEQLAYHFDKAGVRYKTLFYLDQAARKAQRAYANETALEYYGQALGLEERWEWRKGQIEVLHILGRREEEAVALRALEAIPGAPAFEIAYLWGQYYEAVSDYAQAQISVERALAASREWANRIDQVNCLSQLGLIARRQGDYGRARDCYQQALGLFQHKDTCSPEEAQAFAMVFNGLGIVHRLLGNFGEAKACHEQALELSQHSGNRRGVAETFNNLGSMAYYQRDFDQAIIYYNQAVEIRRSIGDRAGEGTGLYNLALAANGTGDYGLAEKYLFPALSIQQAVNNRWEELNIWNELGFLYYNLGDFSEAQSCLERGLGLGQAIGDEAGQAYILANLGLVACGQNDLSTAERLLSQGLALAQAHDDKYLVSTFYSYLGDASLRAGHSEQAIQQAIQQATAALELRRETGSDLLASADLATLAAAHFASGAGDKALDYVQQDVALLDKCGGVGPEWPQRDYFVCYQVLHAAGQTQAAHKALRSAHQLVAARAEKITAPNLRQSFLEKAPTNKQIVEEAKRVLGL